MSKPNGQQRLDLTPMQLATLLVFDLVGTGIQTGMNQLGGFLKLTREAEVLANLLQQLVQAKEAMVAEWSRKVVVAPAAALSAIDAETKKAH